MGRRPSYRPAQLHLHLPADQRRPTGATETLVVHIDTTAFQFYDYSYGATWGVTGFVVAVGLAIVYLTLQRRAEAAEVLTTAVSLYRRLQITENLPALALVDAAFVVPIGIWILKNLSDNVPHEIREAALVDGAGLLGVLWRIMLPISAPGLVAISVVAFFYAWNGYVFAVTMITKDAIRPASVGLSTLISMLDTPIDRVLAAGLLFAILSIIFYLLVQRYVVAGLTAGAVKG